MNVDTSRALANSLFSSLDSPPIDPIFRLFLPPLHMYISSPPLDTKDPRSQIVNRVIRWVVCCRLLSLFSSYSLELKLLPLVIVLITHLS